MFINKRKRKFVISIRIFKLETKVEMMELTGNNLEIDIKSMTLINII